MPRRKRSYFTGLVTDLHHLRGWPRTIQGAWWIVAFAKTSSTRTYNEGREVVITAPSWLAAQRALKLIVASIRVLEGQPMLVDVDERLVAWNDVEPEVDRDVFRAQRGELKIRDIPAACRLAARASRRRAWQYAVTKYQFSQKLWGAFAADLDPFRSRHHFGLSRFAEDHVIFAHAIIAAYSAIEDLGLELRASRENPSRLKGGAWNPVVKAELESRLRRAGVPLEQTLLWTIRGSSTNIHRLRQVPLANRARWAGGLMVRDGHVAWVDAIAYADWLRDKVAAHGAKRKLTPSLSPYDVVNVQHVARRLIMEVLCGGRRCWDAPTPRRRWAPGAYGTPDAR